jgi:hypothetical protein
VCFSLSINNPDHAVGARLLLRFGSKDPSNVINEAVITEWASRGRYVRLRNPRGDEGWFPKRGADFRARCSTESVSAGRARRSLRRRAATWINQ